MARYAALGLVLAALGCQDYKLNNKVEHGGDTAAECVLDPAVTEVEVDSTCLVVPVVGTFTPVVEWQWAANDDYPGFDDIMSTPAAGNLTDDNGDGSIDELDIPEVVTASFANGQYTQAGTVTAISGDGSGQRWSVAESGGYHPASSSGVAIGDIDADGVPEVCFAGMEVSVICVTNHGTPKWTGGTTPYAYGAPALGDLDGDGMSEVIFGNTVLNADGTLRWQGASGAGYWLSFPIDVDQDGHQEVFAGNTLYGYDGTPLWNDGSCDGMGAAGDFDLDGIPELVHTCSSTVTVTNADGTVRWQVAVPGGGGGPPTVADFDDDGMAEIGVAGASMYSVIDGDGTVLWSQPVQDYSSSVTGSSVFDFEGDGAADVVYADEITLWVYDGATGAVKFIEDQHASGTLYEYPLIVDVDNDGQTEIVLPSNNYAYEGWNGITVLGDLDGSWRPSRTIWNQFAYSISNVNDDGSIPATPEPNWERWNNFRAGGTTLGNSDELANLVPADPQLCCNDDGTVDVIVQIQNVGLADSTAFTSGVYDAGGTVVASGSALTLLSGNAQALGFNVAEADWRGSLSVWADDSARIEECNEDDNVLDLGKWPCE